jgi:tRNA 2-thiouridine synthesizing protein A
MNVSVEVDARGLHCPVPILRARKAMVGLSAGQVLKMITTDPGSLRDMEAFCRQTGNELMESGQEDGSFVFLVRKN